MWRNPWVFLAMVLGAVPQTAAAFNGSRQEPDADLLFWARISKPYRGGVMARIGNTEKSYGAAAIAVHWLMAVILIALVAVGLYMVRLPDVGFDTTKIGLILYHKELGILVLALAT